MPIENAPTLITQPPDAGQAQSAVAGGIWQVHTLSEKGVIKGVNATLQGLKNQASVAWDLSRIARMDHIGAQMFWNAWG